jgi:hypothetical protein
MTFNQRVLNEWFIDGQGFSRSYDSATYPCTAPPPSRQLDRRHTGRLRKRDKFLTEEGEVGERGWARSRIISPQKACSSINHQCFLLLTNIFFSYLSWNIPQLKNLILFCRAPFYIGHLYGTVSHQWCDLFYRLLHSYTRHIERVVGGERDILLSAQEWGHGGVAWGDCVSQAAQAEWCYQGTPPPLIVHSHGQKSVTFRKSG